MKPKRKRNNSPERQIEREILAFLEDEGILAFKIKSMGTFDPIRKIYRTPPKNFRRGVSDILGIYQGRPLAIEVKSKTGVLSQEQREFLSDFNEHGGIALVARSLADVIEALKKP